MIRRLAREYDEQCEPDGYLWVTLSCGHRSRAKYKRDGEPRRDQWCSTCSAIRFGLTRPAVPR